MTDSNYPRVIYPGGLDERLAFETPMKGWINIRVEVERGKRYSLYLSDPVRLQQELAELVEHGEPCFAEPGLVILPMVTVEAIEETVQFLWQNRFFSQLKPDDDFDSE